MNKVVAAITSVTIVAIGVILYFVLKEYYVLESVLLAGMVLGLLIMWIRHMSVEKKLYEKTHKNGIDKNSDEYKAYKNQALTIWGYEAVLLTAYVIVIALGFILGKYNF